MQTKYTAFILAIFLSVSTQAQQLPDIATIIKKHTKAMGGKKAWQNMGSYQLANPGRSGLGVHYYAQKPNKSKYIFVQKDRPDYIKSYDGKNGWVSAFGKYETMRAGEEIEMAEEPVFYEELIFAKDNGYPVQLLGEEIINGQKTWKLQMIKSQTDTHTYWLNANTYLIEMTGEYSEDKAHAGIYYKTAFSDFREVDGLMFPFTIQLIPSDRSPITIPYSNIIVNPKISNDFFTYQITSTRELIEYRKAEHKEGHLKAYTFTQETTHYKDDGSVEKTSIWYEAIQYPDKFRIDFGDRANGNTNLYRNDSIYVYREHELVHGGSELQEFLLMEGDIFYYPTDTVLSRLRKRNINPDIFTKTTYNNEAIYIIGAEEGDLNRPQIWLHAEHFYPVRRITTAKNGKLIDVRYHNHVQKSGHWIESRVDIYINDKLIQLEKYTDIEVKSELPPELFQPGSFLQVQDADLEAVKANFTQQAACWNAEDLECYVQAYFPGNASMTVSRAGITKGTDNILKQYKKYFPRDKMGKLHFDQFQYRRLSPEYYYVIGRFNLKYDNAEELRQGWFSVLMQKVDGKWYIVSDHSS